MQIRSRGHYKIRSHETVAEGADMRVTILTLDPGECVPWHWHSEVADDFLCMEGPMVVETRAPRHEYVLQPGQRCSVSAKTAHYVHGVDGGPCRFLLVQGVGVYDYNAVG